jgi:hypothetical protein
MQRAVFQIVIAGTRWGTPKRSTDETAPPMPQTEKDMMKPMGLSHTRTFPIMDPST